MDIIREQLKESIRVKSALLEDGVEIVKDIADTMVKALKDGHYIYLMGNGGSAADAQHIAAELTGRYKKERPALPVISFATNISVVTAIANDYGYEYCFVRQVEAFVRRGDVVVGISTSGRSKNIVNAMRLARERGAYTIAFTGKDGGALKDYADLCLTVPSADTPRIQESHITVAHIICSIIEEELFG